VFDVFDISGLLDILVDGTVERKRLTYRSKVDFISISTLVGMKTQSELYWSMSTVPVL